MSSADTRTLIQQAVENFGHEVPALQQLKLVMRLELRSHGDVPIWRVEVPGPKISKDVAADARLDVSVDRPQFNQLDVLVNSMNSTMSYLKQQFDAMNASK